MPRPLQREGPRNARPGGRQDVQQIIRQHRARVGAARVALCAMVLLGAPPVLCPPALAEPALAEPAPQQPSLQQPGSPPPAPPRPPAYLARPAPTLPMTAAEAARAAAATALPADPLRPEPFEALPGGRLTADPADPRTSGPAVLTLPAPTLGTDTGAGLDFALGAAMFGKLWVAAPSRTRASDGLGPRYNARNCLQCHPDNGRGAPLGAVTRGPSGTVARLSVPLGPATGVTDAWHPTGPDPLRGQQLQDHALPGLPPEGSLRLHPERRTLTLAGGETVTLTRTQPQLLGADGQPVAGTEVSLRTAPPMIGQGLLEAIPAAALLARADPLDRDGDGISGRVNLLPDPARPDDLGPAGWLPGRFGWKAGQPGLVAQVASAFALDLGISSPLHPEGWGDCTAAQADCRARPDGNDPGLRDGTEIGAEALALTAAHVASLAVPPRADPAAPQVLAGKAQFLAAGCAACHVPKHVTGRLADDPAGLGFQLAWPWSDLLLHDMGEGLADHRPEGAADGREWRTAPLWGLGLARRHGTPENYLHDGRAGSILEAILWHGGEAAAARDRVIALPPPARADLIRFLESL